MNNMKDVIRRIKEESNNLSVPNLRKETINMINNKESKVKVYKRPSLKLALGGICLFVIALAIIIPLSLGSDNTKDSHQVSQSRRTYAQQAATLFSLVGDSTTNLSLGFTESEANEIADRLDDYMMLIEEVSNKENTTYELLELSEGDYKYQLNYSIDINGNKQQYTMFFNETPKNQDDDDDLDEVSSRINGYILKDNVKYYVSGEKEVEDEETEVELRLYLSSDRGTYYEVSQEIESNENEYEYKYYENYQEVKSFELSIEKDLWKKEISLEITELDREISLEIEYYKSKIIIEFEMPDYEGEVAVTLDESGFTYNFGNIKIKRESKNMFLL